MKIFSLFGLVNDDEETFAKVTKDVKESIKEKKS
jgi:hypothetical protein